MRLKRELRPLRPACEDLPRGHHRPDRRHRPLRHLLEVGHTDTLPSVIIAQLREQGMREDSTAVQTADRRICAAGILPEVATQREIEYRRDREGNRGNGGRSGA